MSDTFETIKVEPERDRYGRYMIHPAKGGKPKAYTRATTVAETLDDRYNLEAWKVRTTALGIVQRPDLYAAIASTPADEKAKLNKLCDQAREAAAGSAGANLGTALHRFTERINRGEDVKVPAPWDADIAAYKTVLHDNQVVLYGSAFIERIVVLESLGIAGMFDVLTRHLGYATPMVTDLKTGATLDFSWCAIAVQLAIYAHADTLYDPATKTHEAMPPVDQDKALVIHLPAGKATCTLYEVDIAAGWEAAQHALWTRNWRKRKNLATAVEEAVAGEKDGALVGTPAGDPRRYDGASTPLQVGGGEPAPVTPTTVEQAPPAVDVGGGEPSPSLSATAATATPAGPTNTANPKDAALYTPHGASSTVDPSRRQALVERVKNLRPEWLEEMAAKWPVGVPTFKQTPHHTDEQLNLIEKVLDGIDWAMPEGSEPEVPPVPDREPEPELPPAAKSVVTHVTLNEGYTLDEETVDAVKATIAGLDKVLYSQVDQWAGEAADAGRPFSLRKEADRTQRRFEIMRAAIALSPYEPDVQRAALGFVMGDEVQTSVTIGAALGSLTIGEAERLALLAESLGTSVSVVYGADGPTFDGEGLKAVAA